jgi:glutamate-5-semialdehyde dehydrogenase
MKDIQGMMEEMGGKARAAARALAAAPSGPKDAALARAAALLRERSSALLAANRRDVEQARAAGLAAPLVERLALDGKKIEEMANALLSVAALPDPVGEVTSIWTRPSGLRVGRMRVPIGVIGIVYESRPNVTVDAAALCLKSGNACILRGGSEALESNRALAEVLAESLDAAHLPAGAVQVVPTADREAVRALLRLDRHVDLIIPRGGKPLVRMIMENSVIPVIKHLDGVCHTFVDESADVAMAVRVCVNAKAQRPATCNAMETLLVHRAIAPAFLPPALEAMRGAGVEVRACPESRAFAPWAKEAKESDWGAEFLDRILAVRVVAGMEEAMEHIARFGSAHTDAIITDSHERAQRFLREVDSAAVMVNASTRLNDGFQFGLGAEIGISTDKLHARGPMGLAELTCQKFIVMGTGQVRE